MIASRYRIGALCVLLVTHAMLLAACGSAAEVAPTPVTVAPTVSRSATVTPPATEEPEPTPSLANLSPREVAETHYGAIARDDWDLWVATLSADNRTTAQTTGGTAELWWQTARRYARDYGVTYRFLRGDREEPAYQKLFFDRLNADGTSRGSPVPIHLTLEEDGWRVESVTY